MNRDKYEYQKLDEEIIEFNDFGFKMVVIQELMYNRNFLSPKFDLVEFVELYDKRTIDLEKEGYKPVPEVTQYFNELQIPKRLAIEITKIDSDAGDDIFLQLLFHGSGDEDYWDIKTAKDAKQFPNLKKVRLSYLDDHVLNELQEMGIEVDF